MTADYLIVGGGSAGCVLAARLSEDEDCRVVLLEAGPDFGGRESMPASLQVPEGNTTWDERFLWGYPGRLTQAQEPRRIVRGRVIGGSGAINGSLYLRGVPEDYDAWGSELWTWESVLPYFNAVETDLDFGEAPYHGSAGPLPVRRPSREEWLPLAAAFHEAALGAGHADQPDLNAPGVVGVGPVPRNVDAERLRVSPALAYLSAARGRKNLEVIGDTTVTKIVFDGMRATGVEAIRDGQPLHIEAGEVILSAGAIASPQLLMLSGIGPAAELERLGIPVLQDLAGVGGNLSDHPIGDYALQARPGLEQPPGTPSGQLTLFLAGAGPSAGRELKVGSHAVGGTPDSPPSFRFNCSLGSPRSRGRVFLTSPDPHDAPRLEYGYMADEADRARMRNGLRACAELARQPAIQAITVPGSESIPDRVLADDAALDAHVAATIGSSSHGMGTCRMGLGTDPLAVVDDRLRVHGLERLRVIDASVAPLVPRANAHSTVLMIGERAAALVRGRS